MSTYLDLVLSAIGNEEKVSVKLADGNTLAGILTGTPNGQYRLQADSGKPYYVNSDNVIWVRQQ